MKHKGLHSRSNIDKPYISRKEGGREFFNVEDTVNLAIIGISRYVDNSEESLLSTARQIIGSTGVTKADKEYKVTRVRGRQNH